MVSFLQLFGVAITPRYE